MAMTLGEIVVNIRSDTSHLVKGFNRAENMVSKASKNMTKVIKTLTAAYIGLNAIDIARNFGKQVDTMTLINTKLKLATNSTQELATAQKELFKISQETRAGFSESVDLYERMSRSTKGLNVEQKELLDLTKTINKAMIISGGTAQSMNAAIIQLGQAFSGDFKSVGQEMQSIREQTPRLYQAFLDGTKMSKDAFKKAAEDGKLSSKIILEALKSQGIAVNEEFQKVNKTIDQSSTNAKSATLKMIGEFDKIIDITGSVTGAIDGFTDSIKNIDSTDIEETSRHIKATAIAIASMTIAMKGYTVASALAATSNTVLGGTFGAVNRAILITTLSTKALSLAIKTIPLVAVAGLIAVLADEWMKADEAHKGYNETSNELSPENLLAGNRAKAKQLEDLIESGRFASVVVDNWRKNLEKLNAEFDVLSSKDEGVEEKAEETLKFLQLTNTAQNQAAQALADFNRENFEAELEAKQALAKFDEEQLDIKLQGEQEFNSHVMAFYAMRDDLESQALDSITSSQDKLLESFLAMESVVQGIWDTDKMEKFYKVQGKLLNDSGKDSKRTSKTTKDAFRSVYSDMTSIMGAFYDEDDERKKKQSEVDRALSLVKTTARMADLANVLLVEGAKQSIMGTTALVNALTTPGGLPAQLAAFATIAAMIASLGIALGGDGGGGSASSVSGATMRESELQTSMIELSTQPIVDELERHTELLEIIGLEGTAGRARLAQSDIQFKMDTKLLAEEIIRGTQTVSRTEAGASSAAEWERTLERIGNINENVGKTLFEINEAQNVVTFSAKTFRENTLQSLSALFNENYLQLIADWKEAEKDGARGREEILAWTKARGIENINQLQEITHEYISTLSDVVSGLTDAKDSFKDIFDELTTGIKFADRDLEEAQKTVSGLIGKDSNYTEYLKKQVLAIESVEKEFTTDITTLFLSKDPSELEAQAEALSKLNDVMDTAFTVDRIEDAVNAVEAIEMFGEALVVSTGNMKSWTDSFKTETQIAKDLFAVSGVVMAESFRELDKLFLELASDATGLSDADLELLESNKTFLEKRIEQEQDAQEEIQRQAEKAHEASRKAMIDAQKESLNAQKLLASESISGLKEILKDTAKDISTVESSLGSLTGIIDKLKGAALGSTFTIDAFFDSMTETMELSKVGDVKAFSESLKSTIGFSSVLLDRSAFEFDRDQKFAQLVAAKQFEGLEDTMMTELSVLQQIEENTKASALALERQISGLNTSIGALSTATASRASNNLIPSTSTTAYQPSSMSSLVTSAYNEVLGRNPQVAGLNYWVGQLNSGDVALTDLYKAVAFGALGEDKNDAQNWLAANSFANGSTNIPFDMSARIHQGEIIVPETFSNGLRNGDLTMGNQSEVVELLNGILSKLEEQRTIQDDSKDIQDASLEKLEKIEEAS